MKVFQAAQIIRKRLGYQGDPKPNTLEQTVEEVRIAALASIGEARAALQALKVKGLINDREAEDYLDWGYESLLQQVMAFNPTHSLEVGRG